jgi:hypothetical protein
METRIPELGNNVFLTVAGRYTDYNAINLVSEAGECEGRCDTYSFSKELDKDDLNVMVGLKAKLGGINN